MSRPPKVSPTSAICWCPWAARTPSATSLKKPSSEARLRAGQTEEALELLRERLDRGATARDLFRWGRLQTAKGEIAEAKASLRRAAELWANGDADAPELRALQEAAA